MATLVLDFCSLYKSGYIQTVRLYYLQIICFMLSSSFFFLSELGKWPLQCWIFARCTFVLFLEVLVAAVQIEPLIDTPTWVGSRTLVGNNYSHRHPASMFHLHLPFSSLVRNDYSHRHPASVFHLRVPFSFVVVFKILISRRNKNKDSRMLIPSAPCWVWGIKNNKQYAIIIQQTWKYRTWCIINSCIW